MKRDAAFAEFRTFFTDRFGEHRGAGIAGLARGGFGLCDAADAARATGRCRIGGPALLEPGTPWPRVEGHPLSLLAVVDCEALSYWLDDVVPDHLGVLNFFYLDWNTRGRDGRAAKIAYTMDFQPYRLGAVLAADPRRAAETPAPDGAGELAARPQTATPGFGLPDIDGGVEQYLELDPDAYDLVSGISGGDWSTIPHVIHDWDFAFGHPVFPTGNAWAFPADVDERGCHQLLQLDEDSGVPLSDEAGRLHFVVPTGAWEAGDVTGAFAVESFW